MRNLGRLVLTKQRGGYAFDRVQCVSRRSRRAQEERIYLGARVGGHTPEQFVHRDSERVSEFHKRFKRRHALSRLEVRNRGWRHASTLTESDLGQSAPLPDGAELKLELLWSAGRYLTFLYDMVS